jgi:uncharacterized membrane protein YedE/YeeE
MSRERRTAVLTGVVIGVLNLVHYYTTGRIPGVERPFGFFPGGFPVATLLGLTGRSLSPDLVAMILLGFGILLGSMLSARLSGDLTVVKFRKKKLPAVRAVRAGIGGALMGAGTWMAQGCLIKHTLSGAPGLMLSSFVVLAGVMTGIWLSGQIEERWS